MAPGRGDHRLAAAVHLLLGGANLLFWDDAFVRMGLVPVGVVTTSLHVLFLIAQSFSRSRPRPRRRPPRRQRRRDASTASAAATPTPPARPRRRHRRGPLCDLAGVPGGGRLVPVAAVVGAHPRGGCGGRCQAEDPSPDRWRSCAGFATADPLPALRSTRRDRPAQRRPRPPDRGHVAGDAPRRARLGTHQPGRSVAELEALAAGLLGKEAASSSDLLDRQPGRPALPRPAGRARRRRAQLAPRHHRGRRRRRRRPRPDPRRPGRRRRPDPAALAVALADGASLLSLENTHNNAGGITLSSRWPRRRPPPAVAARPCTSTARASSTPRSRSTARPPPARRPGRHRRRQPQQGALRPLRRRPGRSAPGLVIVEAARHPARPPPRRRQRPQARHPRRRRHRRPCGRWSTGWPKTTAAPPLAGRLAALPGLSVDLATVQTNLVLVNHPSARPPRPSSRGWPPTTCSPWPGRAARSASSPTAPSATPTSAAPPTRSRPPSTNADRPGPQVTIGPAVRRDRWPVLPG